MIEEQIRHQIQVEFDSNKGRFSETFIDSIVEICLNFYTLSRNETLELVLGEIEKMDTDYYRGDFVDNQPSREPLLRLSSLRTTIEGLKEKNI